MSRSVDQYFHRRLWAAANWANAFGRKSWQMPAKGLIGGGAPSAEIASQPVTSAAGPPRRQIAATERCTAALDYGRIVTFRDQGTDATDGRNLMLRHSAGRNCPRHSQPIDEIMPEGECRSGHRPPLVTSERPTTSPGRRRLRYRRVNVARCARRSPRCVAGKDSGFVDRGLVKM